MHRAPVERGPFEDDVVTHLAGGERPEIAVPRSVPGNLPVLSLRVVEADRGPVLVPFGSIRHFPPRRPDPDILDTHPVEHPCPMPFPDARPRWLGEIAPPRHL